MNTETAQILRMRARGLPNAQIGALLGVPVEVIDRTVSDVAKAPATYERKRPAKAVPRNRKFWTAERVAELEKLWCSGYSASQIAAQMGCTRNSVIGKVHRNSWARDKSMAQKAQHVLKTIEKKRRKFNPRPNKPPRPPQPANLELMKPKPGDVVRVKSLAELSPDQCRWPIGDPGTPEFGFCGAKKVRGKSYCACHVKRSAPANPEAATRDIERAAAFVGSSQKEDA